MQEGEAVTEKLGEGAEKLEEDARCAPPRGKILKIFGVFLQLLHNFSELLQTSL